MRTRASCSVLSRSKIQTRRDGGSLASLTLLAADESADALVGEHFEEQRVRYAAVDDVDALNAVARGVERRADLRQHAARDHALVDEVVYLLRREPREELALFVQYARRVGHDDQLLGGEDLSELARDEVGINVVGGAIGAGADRRHDRDDAAGLERL